MAHKYFEYKDADGKTLGYVVRLEDKEGDNRLLFIQP
ncbi:MAG: hypothetical protein CNLJKLNK_00488 [Holosporales bacterium]